MFTIIRFCTLYILGGNSNGGVIRSRTTTPNYTSYGVTGVVEVSPSLNLPHSSYNGTAAQHPQSCVYNPPISSISLSSLHDFGM